jgi:ATP-dependent DNA helicase RecQ
LLDALARAALITISNDTFRAPDGRDVTYRKVSITHEGRTPDDETLSTVWLRELNGVARDRKSSRKANRTKAATPNSSAKRRPATAESRDRRDRREASRHRAEATGTIQTDIAVRPRKTSPIVPPLKQFPAPKNVELNATQSALDNRLRAWRTEQAHAVGLPSFFIFSDTVLRDIVLASPESLAELRRIPGLGPDKLDRFGPAVLALCRG